MPGIVVLLNWIAPMSLSSLTSGRTRMLIRLSLRIVGVKARLTPNSLNSIAVSPSVTSVGTGNSPPDRKLAVSPDRAVRLGSARMVTRSSAARASIRLLRSKLLVLRAESAVRPPSVWVIPGSRNKVPVVMRNAKSP